MSEENFEDWDTDFLEEAIKVEEQHLSSQYPPPPLPPPPPPPLTTTSSYLPQEQPLNLAAASRNDFISYSPPRELSQRTADYGNTFMDRCIVAKCAPPSTPVRRSDNAKDLEIERLKKELGGVTVQLTKLKHECFELRKGRDKERVAHSENEEQDANAHRFKRKNSKYGLPAAAHDGVPQEFQNARGSDDKICSGMHIVKSSFKATGVQTDLPGHLDFSKKLQGVWGSQSDQNFGRNLISKLFVACPTDFHVLFGYMGMNTSFKIMDSLAVKNTYDVTLKYHMHSLCASEAAKVSHLYSVITRISNGMIQMEALFGPLLELCSVKNVVIVHRSLRILNVLLKHFLALERKSEIRDNVMVDGLHSRTNIDHFHASEGANSRGLICLSSKDASYASHIPFRLESDAETSCQKGHWIIGNAILLSCINWVSLFELMHQIAMGSTEEHVRLEAVSIMNVIIMRSNAYVEREKFGLTTIFESISQLLRKEASLDVRKEAVSLLYLLLNCPKVLVIFCCDCKDGEGPGAANDNQENALPSKGFNRILEGLADCIASCGNGVEDLELCRNVIIVLAFLASSGNVGTEILAGHKLSREANFLMLILQLLVSEIDRESTVCNESEEILKTRTLLMREALILLNRLVSNPSCSATVLRVLTNSRDMASLTVDVANRLSRKEQTLQQSDTIGRQMREPEIVDLARVFKKRVFTFLGDNIS